MSADKSLPPPAVIAEGATSIHESLPPGSHAFNTQAFGASGRAASLPSKEPVQRRSPETLRTQSYHSAVERDESIQKGTLQAEDVAADSKQTADSAIHKSFSQKEQTSQAQESKQTRDSVLKEKLQQKEPASQDAATSGGGSWSWLGLAQKAVPTKPHATAEHVTQSSREAHGGAQENGGGLKTAKLTQLVEAALHEV